MQVADIEVHSVRLWSCSGDIGSLETDVGPVVGAYPGEPGDRCEDRAVTRPDLPHPPRHVIARGVVGNVAGSQHVLPILCTIALTGDEHDGRRALPLTFRVDAAAVTNVDEPVNIAPKRTGGRRRQGPLVRAGTGIGAAGDHHDRDTNRGRNGGYLAPPTWLRCAREVLHVRPPTSWNCTVKNRLDRRPPDRSLTPPSPGAATSRWTWMPAPLPLPRPV